MPEPFPPTCGVILAGGLARRLGGGDKPLRRVAGRSLLDRAAACLRPHCVALAVNANGDPARFAGHGIPVIPDPVPGHPGPLAGVLAAMDWAAARTVDRAEWVVTVPGDAPFLPDDLVPRLHGERDGADLACAASAGRAHPVAALWPVRLRSALRAALDGVPPGGRGPSVEGWTAAFRVATVCWPAMPPDAPCDPFLNVNTPDDLLRAEALAPLADAAG